MTLLNLLLMPLLVALGLFDGNGTATATAPAGGDSARNTGDGATTSTATAGTATANGTDGDAADGGDDDATDDDEPLGEAGTKALEAFKARARKAEREAKAAAAELEKLRNASKSDTDRALDEAKKTAAAEERTKWEARALRAEAKSALAAAGATDVAIAVAAFLDQHRDLTVTEDGDVEELAATVGAFKKAHPTLFTARVPSGSADQGAKPPAGNRPKTLEEAIAARVKKA